MRDLRRGCATLHKKMCDLRRGVVDRPDGVPPLKRLFCYLFWVFLLAQGLWQATPFTRQHKSFPFTRQHKSFERIHYLTLRNLSIPFLALKIFSFPICHSVETSSLKRHCVSHCRQNALAHLGMKVVCIISASDPNPNYADMKKSF
jgi:hypothetical protein